MAVNEELTSLNEGGTLRRPPPNKTVPKSTIPVVPQSPYPKGWGGPTQGYDPKGIAGVKTAQAKAKAAADAKTAAATTAAADAATAAAKDAAGRDAGAYLSMMLEQWGLGSLAGTAMDLARKGLSTNEITLQLRQSDAYKKRFSGNQERIKAGYAALEPAEYLAVEDSYKRILQSAGLPKGFYDDPSDFAGWIGKNVSATEINERVSDATDAALNSPPHYLEALGQMGLNTGDLAASMLDQNRSLPLLRKTIGTAKIGAASMNAGLGFNQGTAGQFYDQLADSGGNIDAQSVAQGYSQVAAALPRTTELSHLYGEQVGQGDLEKEYIGHDALASQKRARLADLEASQYKGSGGTGQKALGQGSRGEY